MHAIIVGVLVLVLGIAAAVFNPSFSKPNALGILAFLVSIPVTWLGAEWAISVEEVESEEGEVEGTERKDEPASKPVWHDYAAIELKVREIVASELGRDIDEVERANDADEEDDFVGTLAIIARCEKAFGIEIPDEEAEHLATVDQIAKYIEAKLER